MTFENEAQLKKFLIERCTKAVANTEKKLYEEFAGNLNQFYTEFHPEEYIRTGGLFNSLKSTGVVRTGNGAIAEIGFDTPKYKKGWIPLQSGNYGYACWSDKLILDVAMSGSHGGYESGTAIWNDSLRPFGGERGVEDLLRRELKKQGL